MLIYRALLSFYCVLNDPDPCNTSQNATVILCAYFYDTTTPSWLAQEYKASDFSSWDACFKSRPWHSLS